MSRLTDKEVQIGKIKEIKRINAALRPGQHARYWMAKILGQEEIIEHYENLRFKKTAFINAAANRIECYAAALEVYL